uniref:PA domain-containing protein n=1 Tax=Athene cunicularia TaxID=194338 RepID=A0A663M529_ATHCN
MKQVFIFFYLLVEVGILCKTTEAFAVRASVSLFYFNSTSNKSVSEQCDCGLYGSHSPLLSARGLLAIPKAADFQACNANTEFTIRESPWIALIERGNCSFAKKINVAARQGAAAAVIYNSEELGSYM